ncbi:DNA-3-methyladenine glycosylase [Candidatus Gracilibacteria bacterium]|nr:DNA-3-methyladenine glycosylase [Candidatus Gracilibacteria bacterium]
MKKLKPEFFEEGDTVEIAKKLLGKLFVCTINGEKVSGIINETEAYTADDPASHSHLHKITPRNWSMFESPGHIYVYKIYGIYHCLNFSTEPKGFGAGILIRSIIPVEGIEIMKERRNKKEAKNLVNGPGKLCIAFGIDTDISGQYLGDKNCPIGLYDIDYKTPKYKETPRIGISKGQDLLWRFVF